MDNRIELRGRVFETTPHPFTSGGLALGLELAALGIGPGGALLEQLGRVGDLVDLGLSALNPKSSPEQLAVVDAKMRDALAGFAWGALAEHLTAAVLRVDPAIAGRLLAHTTCDGVKLASSAVIDETFSGGYPEFVRVVVHVIRVNRWIPFSGGLGNNP
jgi:hypothetical protein